MKHAIPGDLVQNLFDKRIGLVLEVEPIEFEEEFGSSWVVVLWVGQQETEWVGRDCIKLINRAEIK